PAAGHHLDAHSFPTRRSSDLAIARNISAGGLLVEMSYAPPLGTVVTVHFQYVRDADIPETERGGLFSARGVDEIVARAEVKHHQDRKSTRLNSSHVKISYAVF